MFKSQQKLIAEIHSEFDTAQERLLEEANRVLASLTPQPESVAERLKMVGFTNTPTVKRVEKVKETKTMVEKEANLILYYKQTYPFLKFLTEDELDRICDKYNLIFAGADRYIKEVPEKNLRDIEQAQPLKDGDKVDWERTEYEKIQQELISRIQYSGAIYIPDFWARSVNHKIGIFIAAPKSHFNLDGLEKTSKFGWGKPEVKDPIVFRYVRGGIQVLTKWGLEGEDPSLVVEKLN